MNDATRPGVMDPPVLGVPMAPRTRPWLPGSLAVMGGVRVTANGRSVLVVPAVTKPALPVCEPPPAPTPPAAAAPPAPPDPGVADNDAPARPVLWRGDVTRDTETVVAARGPTSRGVALRIAAEEVPPAVEAVARERDEAPRDDTPVIRTRG